MNRQQIIQAFRECSPNYKKHPWIITFLPFADALKEAEGRGKVGNMAIATMPEDS
ncbi:hypothetical protein [Nitrosococcus watsonii]|uniref:hypothetical protein n=1 Tax=Nitrosococcus watsonii TaxID=473531 RepID=UPI0030D72D4A